MSAKETMNGDVRSMIERLIAFDTTSRNSNLDLSHYVRDYLADLGVSSHQIDQPKRGFSFQVDGPLDLRMDQRSGMTAAELIDKTDEVGLARLIKEYGEERLSEASRRVA